MILVIMKACILQASAIPSNQALTGSFWCTWTSRVRKVLAHIPFVVRYSPLCGSTQNIGPSNLYLEIQSMVSRNPKQMSHTRFILGYSPLFSGTQNNGPRALYLASDLSKHAATAKGSLRTLKAKVCAYTIYVYVCDYIHVDIYPYIYTCLMCTGMYVCMYGWIYMYLHICRHMHIFTCK